jgi:Ca-activated chloride channel homolog
MRLGGNTRMYDAIRFAANKLGSATGPELMRRALIVISDGDDNCSTTLMYEAIQAALHAETAIFALSSNDLSGREFPVGEAALGLISRPTGGGVLPAHSKPEIAHAFDQVKATLRNQYVVGYKPANFQPDGSFRSVQILPRQNKFRVHCRRGYFASKAGREN